MNWVDWLKTDAESSGTPVSISSAKASQWLKLQRGPDMCGHMKGVAKRAALDLEDLQDPAADGGDGAAYDTMRDAVWEAIRSAIEGHAGVRAALRAIKASYSGTLIERGDEARLQKVPGDWKRAVSGAIGKVIDLEVPAECQCLSSKEKADLDEHGFQHEVGATEEEQAEQFESLVQQRLVYKRVEQEARQRLAAENWEQPEWEGSLAAELAKPRQPTEYFVESMATGNANILLIGQFKVGKTTLGFNLGKSAVDDLKFLDLFKVSLAEGTSVVYFNFEVDKEMSEGWLEEMQIEHPERLHVQNLQGKSLPITSKVVEDAVVQYLKSINASVWILDPINKIQGAEENSNTDWRAFLDAVDRIKLRAGLKVVVCTTHATSLGEDGGMKARGGTAQMDWATVFWFYRHDGQFGEIPPDDTRYLRAFGRRVDVAEMTLNIRREEQWLYAEAGDHRQLVRADSKAERLAKKARKVVDEHFEKEGTYINSTNLLNRMGFKNTKTGAVSEGRAAIKLARSRGWLLFDQVGNEHRYTPGPESPFVNFVSTSELDREVGSDGSGNLSGT